MMQGTWLEEIGNQLRGVASAFWGEVQEKGLYPLLEPVAPFNRPNFLAPAIAVGGLVGIILLSGVAFTAMGTLLVALLALWLLLVEVFGLSIELHPLGAR